MLRGVLLCPVLGGSPSRSLGQRPCAHTDKIPREVPVGAAPQSGCLEGSRPQHPWCSGRSVAGRCCGSGSTGPTLGAEGGLLAFV